MTTAARERMRVRAPVLAASAGAWIVLAREPAARSLHVHDTAGLQPASWAAGWAVMLAAMMLPLVMAPLRHVRDRSFARRRPRAAALFLAGYGAAWMMAGGVLLAMALAVATAGRAAGVPPGAAAGLAVALAVLWQCSPAKQHCLNRGHAHPPLVPAGPGADLAPLRFGAAHGSWCVGSCWAVMLLVIVLPGGHLPAMAGATAWLGAERIDDPARPGWRIRVPARAVRVALAGPTRLAGRRRPGGPRADVSRMNISSL